MRTEEEKTRPPGRSGGRADDPTPRTSRLTPKPARPRRVAGFSLIELAIVLLIVTILLAGLLVPLSTQVQVRRTEDTLKTLEQVKEALVGYAMSHHDSMGRPYLPCPDKIAPTTFVANLPNDGIEDRKPDNTCDVPAVQVRLEGNLPWVTLGIGVSDAWGNRFRYQVTDVFSNAGAGFTSSLPTQGDITICVTAGCAACTSGACLAAVVLSHGRNGWGARNSNGTVQQAPITPDEVENTNSNSTFVSRSVTDPGSPAREFDDLVVWLSPAALFGRICPVGGCL